MYGKEKNRTRGRKWMALIQKVKTRDKGLCRHCLINGHVTLGTEVDHVKPIARGGTDALDNLQLLCGDCHESKTRADMGYKEQVEIGLDGWPVR